ncbi:hypothetical protein IFM89_029514 [Coptis chinensis]|uniref:Uncharacterized protein n=1 Tax=Coptis chinensis TaxID=261450 RepID=A0A835HVM3_9MAGN|nr:hypothetical protein IFM89_029514 [Coptis chinensis]
MGNTNGREEGDNEEDPNRGSIDTDDYEVDGLPIQCWVLPTHLLPYLLSCSLRREVGERTTPFSVLPSGIYRSDSGKKQTSSSPTNEDFESVKNVLITLAWYSYELLGIAASFSRSAASNVEA